MPSPPPPSSPPSYPPEKTLDNNQGLETEKPTDETIINDNTGLTDKTIINDNNDTGWDTLGGYDGGDDGGGGDGNHLEKGGAKEGGGWDTSEGGTENANKIDEGDNTGTKEKYPKTQKENPRINQLRRQKKNSKMPKLKQQKRKLRNKSTFILLFFLYLVI